MGGEGGASQDHLLWWLRGRLRFHWIGCFQADVDGAVWADFDNICPALLRCSYYSGNIGLGKNGTTPTSGAARLQQFGFRCREKSSEGSVNRTSTEGNFFVGGPLAGCGQC